MLGDKTDVKNQNARGPVCVTMHIVDMGVHLLARALIRIKYEPLHEKTIVQYS